MKNAFLLLELVTLFILPPLLIILEVLPKQIVMPLIWLGALYGYAMIRSKASPKLLFHFERTELYIILKRFALFGTLLLLFVVIAFPQMLFSFMLEKPYFWLLVMILYPLLSAFLQEILFRAFFVHRYSTFFQSEQTLIIVNALLFAYVHALFGNYLAVGLSFLGGVLFMQTFLKTRSVLMSSIEHALYGNLIFTIGIGKFFYHGA